jgi:3-oxoacyl-[acyl-carrier protein] reductase
VRLENKVAVVTGASSGLGEVIARTFLAEGARVVLADLNAPSGFRENDTSLFVKCDVTRSAEVDALVERAVEKFGNLDVMVNNAGVAPPDPAGTLEHSDASWDRTIAVNLTGVFYGVRAAARYMKEHNIRGSIINTSSILGKVGLKGVISYNASKGGVDQITRSAALDLADFGIRVNAVGPGFIRTNMTEFRLADEAWKKMVEGGTPLGHMGEPEDIARAMVYLASDESPYVTGHILYVDGGWTAR